MKSHLERLSDVGRRAVSAYVTALAVLAAGSATALAFVGLALSNASEAAHPFLSQILLVLFSSLTAAALTAAVVLLAAQRMLAVYLALVLHRLSAKAPETAESALSTQEQEVALAPQPPPRSPKTPVERPAAVAQSLPRAAVSEKKKCPYCGRVLPFGDVHVVCPYCGRKLK